MPDAQVPLQCVIAVDLVRAGSTEQEYSVAFGILFWFVAPGQMVPAITEDIAEEDADRGFDQRPYLVGEDRLEAVRDERYRICGSADPNGRANSRNTLPVPDPHRSGRWQQSFHRSGSAGQ
jgi:hypothetical protein